MFEVIPVTGYNGSSNTKDELNTENVTQGRTVRVEDRKE